ncbi:hypothetical protein N9E15_02600 [Planktomarina temperata]|nr:hypothetical protein [Planktomarina temperata]
MFMEYCFIKDKNTTRILLTARISNHRWATGFNDAMIWFYWQFLILLLSKHHPDHQGQPKDRAVSPMPYSEFYLVKTFIFIARQWP